MIWIACGRKFRQHFEVKTYAEIKWWAIKDFVKKTNPEQCRNNSLYSRCYDLQTVAIILLQQATSNERKDGHYIMQQVILKSIIRHISTRERLHI